MSGEFRPAPQPTRTKAVVVGLILTVIGVALLLALIPVYNSTGGAMNAVWSYSGGRRGFDRAIKVRDVMLILGALGVFSIVLGAWSFLRIWFAAADNERR